MESHSHAHPAALPDWPLLPRVARSVSAPIDLATRRTIGGRSARLQAAFEETVEAFLSHLGAEGGVSANTVRHYAHDLDMFVRYLVKCRPRVYGLSEVRPVTVLGFMRYMAEVRGNARESNRRRLAALRRLFEYLQSQERIAHDPTEALEIKAKPALRPVTLDLDECRRLLEAAKTTAFPVRDHAIFRLFLTTGCTLSELVNLRLEDVALDIGVVTFVGRCETRRDVRLSPGCLEALRRYAAARPKAPSDRRSFFLNKRSEPVTKGAVYHSFRIALNRAEIQKEGLTIHSLRHTCLALLWEVGVSIQVLQQLAGHRSPATTRMYRWAGPRAASPQPWDWVHPVDG